MLNIDDMFSRDLSLEIQRACELVTSHIEHQQSLLHQRVNDLKETCTAVAGCDTEPQLHLALSKALEDLEFRDDDFLESIVEFEDGVRQIEESSLDLAAALSRESITPTELGDEGSEVAFESAETETEAGSSSMVIDISSSDIFSKADEIIKTVHPSDADLAAIQLLDATLREAKLTKIKAHSQWLEQRSQPDSQKGNVEHIDTFEKISLLDTLIEGIRSYKKIARKQWKGRDKSDSSSPVTSRRTAKKTPSTRRKRIEPRVAEPSRSFPPEVSRRERILPVERTRRKRPQKFYSLSTKKIESYETDYLHYRNLFFHLRTTARNQYETEEALRLGQLLQARRSEISQWREKQGYRGARPKLIKEVFTAVKPDSSNIKNKREKQRSEKHRNQKSQRKMNQEVQEILQDLIENPGAPPPEGGFQNLNRRVFRTGGRMNPRARK